MGSKISFCIWNVHGMDGYRDYEMPNFVVDEILSKEKDIVILTEFIRSKKWGSISRKFARKYWRYTYCSNNNTNEILILIKKGILGIDDDILKGIKSQMMPANNKNPNYLHIVINLPNNKSLFVFGIRIRDDDHVCQFDLFNSYLKTLGLTDNDYIFGGGDFNEWKNPIQKKVNFLSIHTPKVDLGDKPFEVSSAKESTISTWSAILTKKDGSTGKAVIDHVATKNCSYVMLEDYCWDFVKKENGYGDLTATDVLSDVLYHPDHAILLGEFKL